MDRRHALPHAAVLVLVRDTTGAIFLYRVTADGGFAGDTWHPDVAQAKEQAAFEYGTAVGGWHPVPDDITEIETLVRSLNP